MEYFIFDINTFTDEEYLKWFSLMNEEKQKKVSRYKNINRRKCSVAGEKLVKEYIGKALQIIPESIKILQDNNGKPFIPDCPVHFNISHSENMLAIVFSEKEIGIDIEKIKPISISVLKRFFSEKEQIYVLGNKFAEADFEKQDSKELLERFYRVYTIKEAICKKSGIGIKGLRDADALPFLNNSFKKNDFIISIV